MNALGRSIDTTLVRAADLAWAPDVPPVEASTPIDVARRRRAPREYAGRIGAVSVDRALAGVFDVVTDALMQRRLIGTAIVAKLLAHAWERGVRRAFLPVTEDNGAARSIYRRFGDSTAYRYHYRARVHEVE
ncbi:MAG TPA: GNAT family N-acetyltransferase [Casimicrobiaceae bacterium]|nr:GNAT family N-acetyltransferase [Casimicrobiaceae bacterium]